MRRLGLSVVVLGLAALGYVVVDAIGTPPPAPADQANGRPQAAAVWQLIGWGAVFGALALVTLVSGLRDLAMYLPGWQHGARPLATDGETAAMINAEVNEGGPPSPIPCDTPVPNAACQESQEVMSAKPSRAETCPAPDRVFHLPLGKACGGATSTMLMKTDGLELIRLVVPAGKEIPPHRVPGEITVQCVEGVVALEHDGRAIQLHPGDVLHLCPQEIHALRGLADSSVLVTRVRPHADEVPEKC